MGKKEAVNHKILVVEDDEANIMLASVNLEDLGYAYDIARNSKEALKLVKSNTYSVIFMDIHMAGLDGFETTRMIRSLEAKGHIPQTPIVALTNDDDKERCLESGMDDFMTKPIRLKSLKDCIESTIAVHH